MMAVVVLTRQMYAMLHEHAMSHRMTLGPNLADVTPQALLRALLERDGLTANALAVELHRPKMQGTLSRYLRGETKDPRSAWVSLVAKKFKVPESAFRDEETATQVAARLGFVEGAPVVSMAGQRATKTRQNRIDAGMLALQIADLMRSVSPSKRTAAAALFSSAATAPDDAPSIASSLRALLEEPSGKQVAVAN